MAFESTPPSLGYPRFVILILMGVSGAGKTTVGRLVAQRLGWEFLDADDFHSRENREKMATGVPLTDADRGPWLESLATALRLRIAEGRGAVLACSALRRAYRETLRVDDGVRLVHLRADFETIRRRLQERKGHYFRADLLASQFEALEETAGEGALVVDAGGRPEALAALIVAEEGLDPSTE
jgi:gluconokinase